MLVSTLVFLTGASTAANAGFAPDQPGLGSSTGVVPHHQSMLEVGLGLGGTLGESPVLQVPGLTGRIGLQPDNLELRLTAPGLLVPFRGPLMASPLKVGMKWVGQVGDAVGWSVVPSVATPLPGNGDPLGVLAGDLEANATWDDTSGDFGLWTTANAGGGRDASWWGGAAGAYYNPNGVGLYAQSGWQGGLLVGGGGWWEVDHGLQANLGVDVFPGVPATIQVQAGVSVQR
ncbi:MAG TPA: hypothetical protein DFR83_26375 [Deltaproteobacteria bacterium]|nr:hypothetical protein [Deltaproteobacteria bacterium]